MCICLYVPVRGAPARGRIGARFVEACDSERQY